MAKREIRVTAERELRLLAAVQHLAGEPVGQHLTDQDFTEYALESPTADIHRIDLHLESCESCAATMEQILETMEAARAWERAQIAIRLRLAAQLVAIILYAHVALRKLTAATTIVDGETPDGLLHWRIVEDDQALTVRLDSDALELEGTRLRLMAGNLERIVTLAKVAPDQVGAEAVFSREERAHVAEGEPLRIEILDEDSTAASAGAPS